MNFMDSIVDVCNSYYAQEKYANKMGLNRLSNKDIDICKYVLSQFSMLYDTDFGKEHVINFHSGLFKGNKISFEELCNQSVEEFKCFDDVIYERVRQLSKDTPYCNSFSGDFYYTANVGFRTYRKVLVNSGKVHSIVIPYNYYDFSVYLLTHEYIHALKDTNYSEFVNVMVVGEVLPIFYELINFDNKLGNELALFRLKHTMSLKRDFLEVTSLVDYCNSFADKLFGNYKLYEYYRSACGVYLNSYYYAVILYNMYKQSPKKILDMVSRVLKKETTTLEMLQQLGIYGDIKGEVFERELGNIRKLIK